MFILYVYCPQTVQCTVNAKERCTLFGFISHTNITNLAKKERKRTQRSFYKVKKELNVLFSIYIYIYISIYIYIYPGLGTAFFYVLNASFFCGLLKQAKFFCVLFSSFWRLMKPKITMRYFAFFS